MQKKESTDAPFFSDPEVIILTARGVWMADGYEITHEPTRKLFARSIFACAGGFELRIGRETKRITVEDTPYFVTRVEGNPLEGFTLWLNDETRERLAPRSLAYQPGRLTARVKNAAFEARFLSAPYHDLLFQAEGNPELGYSVTIEGQTIRLVS